jgi:hypothetical protein
MHDSATSSSPLRTSGTFMMPNGCSGNVDSDRALDHDSDRCSVDRFRVLGGPDS